MKIAYLFLVFISLVLFSSCSKESATIVSPSNTPYDRTIFVDPVNGNDLNTGREVTLPVKTLFKAVSKAINGDTIYVRGGVYASFKEVIIKTWGMGITALFHKKSLSYIRVQFIHILHLVGVKKRKQ